MNANKARYISTPGIIGMTLGMLSSWWGVCSHNGRPYERTDDKPQVKPDVAAGGPEVDEVARADADDTAQCHKAHQMARRVENHGEADGRYGGCKRILVVGMMGSHRQVLGKVVYATHPNGKGNAESHGEERRQRSHCPSHAYLGVAGEHVADKIDERYPRHDEQRAGQQRMPRRAGCKDAHRAARD